MSATTIIFSRDRPAQVNLLLRSLYEHAGGFCDPVTVLYTASNPFYSKGYEKCKEEFPGIWRRQSKSFARDVRMMLSAAKQHVMFLCDDDVFVEKLNWWPKPDMALEEHPQLLCVSLRLGRNTTTCYPLSTQQSVPEFLTMQGDLLGWEWRRAQGDFSYPGSLDGHVWRLKDFRNLIGAAFNGPNQLEDALVTGCRTSMKSFMGCYDTSTVVGVPINRVAETHLNNKAGARFPISTEEMNKRFLAGERIKLDTFDPSHVTGAHTEFPLVWV